MGLWNHRRKAIEVDVRIQAPEMQIRRYLSLLQDMHALDEAGNTC